MPLNDKDVLWILGIPIHPTASSGWSSCSSRRARYATRPCFVHPAQRQLVSARERCGAVAEEPLVDLTALDHRDDGGQRLLPHQRQRYIEQQKDSEDDGYYERKRITRRIALPPSQSPRPWCSQGRGVLGMPFYLRLVARR